MTKNNSTAARTISAIAFLIMLTNFQAAFGNIYDESIDGDISDDPNMPTIFDLDSGFGVAESNLVTGSLSDLLGADPIDSMSVIVAQDCTVDIIVNSYTGDFTLASLLDDAGEIVGFANLSDSSPSQSVFELMGIEVVPPGEYTLQLDLLNLNFNDGADYQFDYQCTCPVPEPNSMAFFALLLPLAFHRRRLAILRKIG